MYSGKIVTNHIMFVILVSVYFTASWLELFSFDLFKSNLMLDYIYLWTVFE